MIVKVSARHVWCRRRMDTGFGGGNLEERDHLEYLDLTWSIILKWVLKGIRWNDVDWVYVGRGRDSLQALVNILKNLWVP
jgi:hypothetical protein